MRNQKLFFTIALKANKHCYHHTNSRNEQKRGTPTKSKNALRICKLYRKI